MLKKKLRKQLEISRIGGGLICNRRTSQSRETWGAELATISIAKQVVVGRIKKEVKQLNAKAILKKASITRIT